MSTKNLPVDINQPPRTNMRPGTLLDPKDLAVGALVQARDRVLFQIAQVLVLVAQAVVAASFLGIGHARS